MEAKLILDLHDWFLTEKIAEMEHKISFLEGDQRQDEANLFKARRNVFDIFHKMLLVSRKKGEDAVKAYRSHLTIIPQNWVESRKQAEQFGDARRLAVEDMKLSTLHVIVQHLNDTMGEGRQA